MAEQHGYQVELQVGRGRRVETVDEYSHQRAVKVARRMWPEATIVKVRRDWTPIGDCTACGIPIFEGDCHRHRGDQLRCNEC